MFCAALSFRLTRVPFFCQAIEMLTSLSQRTELPASSEASRRLRRQLFTAGEGDADDTSSSQNSPESDAKTDHSWTHAAWSRAQDEQLVVFVQWLAQKRGTAPKELKTAEFESALSTEAGRRVPRVMPNHRA